MKNPLSHGAACAFLLLSHAVHCAPVKAPPLSNPIHDASEAAFEAASKAIDAEVAQQAAVDEHTRAMWDLMAVLHYERRMHALIDSAAGANPGQRANAHYFIEHAGGGGVVQMVMILRTQIDAAQARALALAYATPVGQQALEGVRSAAVDAFNAGPQARLLAGAEQASRARMQEVLLGWADFAVVQLASTATARTAEYSAQLNDPARRGTLPPEPQPTGHAGIDRMMAASRSMVRDSALLAWRLDEELDRLGSADLLSPATMTSAEAAVRARRQVALMRSRSQAFIVSARAVVAASRAQLATNGVAAHDRLIAALHRVFDKRLAQLTKLEVLQRRQYGIYDRMFAFAGERPGQFIVTANGVEASDSAGRTRWLGMLGEMRDTLDQIIAASAPVQP